MLHPNCDRLLPSHRSSLTNSLIRYYKVAQGAGHFQSTCLNRHVSFVQLPPPLPFSLVFFPPLLASDGIVLALHCLASPFSVGQTPRFFLATLSAWATRASMLQGFACVTVTSTFPPPPRMPDPFALHHSRAARTGRTAVRVNVRVNVRMYVRVKRLPTVKLTLICTPARLYSTYPPGVVPRETWSKLVRRPWDSLAGLVGGASGPVSCQAPPTNHYHD